MAVGSTPNRAATSGAVSNSRRASSEITRRLSSYWRRSREILMLRGLTSVRYHTTNLERAKRWYAELLGIEPSREQLEYAEFRPGDYQHRLGLLDSRYARNMDRLDSTASTPVGRQRVGPEPHPEGVVVYWHVDDVPAAYDRLLSMRAKPHEVPRDFGDGLIGASVIDPFGNILGIMYDPRYLEVADANQD
jgi:predicted enzyme related to lactoylglutathione lyase